MFSALGKAIKQFSADECMMSAAALAFYTIFAMPPLLFLLVTIVSIGMSAAYEQEMADERARQFLEQQAAQLIGDEAAMAEISNIIEDSSHQSGTWWKSILSLAGIVFGATALVTALQKSLNRVWRVEPVKGKIALHFIMKRLLSLAMILGFGFVLLVSFFIAVVLNTITEFAADQIGIHGNWPMAINQSVSFITTWAFFSLIFRFMPDATVTWKDSVLGAFFTVALFTVGRVVLFYYLMSTNLDAKVGSAAGSLVVILLWVYYSSIILLFGAEFTANISTQPAAPEPGAVATPPPAAD